MKKYYPLIFLLPMLIHVIFRMESFNLGFVMLLALFVLLFVMFEYLGKSRDKRMKKIIPTNKNKLIYIIKFSLLIGLPISLIIAIVIINQSAFINSVIFIIVPLTLLFGWVGLIDWNECYKKQLEQKYSVKL